MFGQTSQNIIRNKYEIKRLSLLETTDISLEILQTLLTSDTIHRLVRLVMKYIKPKSLFGMTFNMVQ